jgi:hypothetical protein
MLLVLGALSLGGVVVLKNAHASEPSTFDTASESAAAKDGGGGWVTLAGKDGGGWISLAGKDGGHIELADKGKDGGSVELNKGKDGGSIELFAKGDGGK